MVRILTLLSLGLFFLGFLSAPTFAQPYSIASGLVPIAPGVTITVVREASLTSSPNYCSGFPHPSECDAPSATSPYLGDLPKSPIGVDAAGSAYKIDLVGYSLGDGDGTYLQRTMRDGVTENVVSLYRQRCLDPPACTVGAYYSRSTPFFLDVTNGRILIISSADIRSKPFDQPIDYRVGILEVSGLPQMFDSLLTFVPTGQSLAILTPAHPDGFRSVDSLQLWTGDVRTLPVWSQATPVTCSAATNPNPGQLLSVDDALPEPALGAGRYYVVASQNGADRRLGRQYIEGAYSARNPSGLLACQ